jgi:hypothetical protein
MAVCRLDVALWAPARTRPREGPEGPKNQTGATPSVVPPQT